MWEFIPECPAWASSFQHRRRGQNRVQRKTNSHRNASKRAHPGVASTQDHLQHWNNLSSEISLIPLSCTQTLLPPASLSTHIHTHGLSDARSNWLASEAWVSSGSSVALWEELICYARKPMKPRRKTYSFTCIMQDMHACICVSMCTCLFSELITYCDTHTHSWTQVGHGQKN